MFESLYKNKPSLRWQLGLNFAILALMATALLTGMALRTATALSLSANREKAASAASGAAMAFYSSLNQFVDPAQSARQLGMAAGGRIIWLGPDGVVRVDSGGEGLNGKILPLPKELFSTEKAVAKVYTTGDKWMAYALAPLPSSTAGSLLLMRDLEEVKEEFFQLRSRLWATGAMLSGIFIMVGLLVSKSLSRPLELITEAVNQMKGGRLHQRVEVDGSQELKRLAQTFNEMASKVAALDEQRRSFVADAAHELRTPLAALKALVESGIEDGAEVQGLVRQIDRMTQLVNSLLTLARLDNPEIAFDPVPLRAKELIEEVLWAMRPLYRKKSLQVEVEHYEEEAWFLGDPNLLHQALTNILDNAIRYTPREASIFISVKVEDGNVYIIVEDTGPGVPEEVLDKLSDRFYRYSPSRDRDTGGSGLGLSIAAEIMRLHDGNLSFDRGPGRGLKAILTLPQRAPEL